jgi:hypothetical protein
MATTIELMETKGREPAAGELEGEVMGSPAKGRRHQLDTMKGHED